VAILLAAAPPATLEGLPLDLEDRITKPLGRRAQVIVLNTAPAGLVHRVLRDGVLLLDRDPSARIGFEVRARNEFFEHLDSYSAQLTGRGEAPAGSGRGPSR